MELERLGRRSASGRLSGSGTFRFGGDLGGDGIFDCTRRNLNTRRWDTVGEVVESLGRSGFFSVGTAIDLPDPDVTWQLLSYCYANRQVGSQRIVNWVHAVPQILRLFGPIGLQSHDLRRFRRNNRKLLALTLEEFFRRSTPSPGQGVRGGSPVTMADDCLLEAIRADVGESDD